MLYPFASYVYAGTITYTSDNKTETLKPWFLIGADGAYSQVREALRRHQRMDFTLNHIKHGYKELTIPPKNVRPTFNIRIHV
jgi:2-polyprenyl-6-methoxyphenol hydroxylase-like FAD-dependent oxidoreductase